MIVDLIKDLARAVVPDPAANEPKHVYRWRQTMAFSHILIGGGLLVHIGIACGYITFLGLTGFATVAQVNDAQQQNISFFEVQLKSAIRDAKKELCTAQMTGNPYALQYSARMLADAKDNFRRMVRKEPEEPGCEQLIIMQPPSR